jgi:DNA-binding transcriptional LysR family regulator
LERLACDRMFVTVMDCGSFAKAASRLGTSSGQASKMISWLEQELGVRLLNRTTRALSPTEVGQAYYESITQVLDDLDALDESIKSRSGIASGKLRLTVPVSFGTVQLIPALTAFARSYPGIELDVSFTDRMVNLVDEGFDAGIRIGIHTDSTLIARRLCSARVVVVAAPEYVASHAGLNYPSDLAACDCILDTNVRDPFTWSFSDPHGAQPFTVSVTGRLRFSSADACVAAAEQGLGVACIPSFIAGPRIRENRLSVLFPAYERPPLSISAIYPPGRHLAMKVRVLVDFLVEQFRGQPKWDQGW